MRQSERFRWTSRLTQFLIILLLLCLAVVSWQWQSAPFVWAEPGTQRWSSAGVALLLYMAFCAVLFLRRRPAPVATVSADGFRVVYASQTGFAERIARSSAVALQDGGAAVSCMSLDTVDSAALISGGRALFVISTTGEGDPPDSAFAFVQDVMTTQPDLSGLYYGLLALGDRSYARFCGFGAALDEWLRACGAKSLFDRVEVDDGEAGALRHWQHQLGQLTGGATQPDWAAPDYAVWCLSEREHLNPGSPGGAVFRVALTPPKEGQAQWTPGDIAEIGPRSPAAVTAAPLPHREYSIASMDADGKLELIVRQMRDAQGQLGIGSGWLTEYAAVGAGIDLRIRENRSFHPPPLDVPMILIGNGTGLAGLRAHLRARVSSGAQRNWLIFGERTRRSDFLCRSEIEAWQRKGDLQRLDLAFSRDDGPARYVQDALRLAAVELQRWVADGAWIYVCGSLQGMAPGVDAVLREVLGSDGVDALRMQGRYRRDVY